MSPWTEEHEQQARRLALEIDGGCWLESAVPAIRAFAEPVLLALAAMADRCVKLEGELAEVESYRRGLQQSKLFEGRPLPKEVTAELEALRELERLARMDPEPTEAVHYALSAVDAARVLPGVPVRGVPRRAPIEGG